MKGSQCSSLGVMLDLGQGPRSKYVIGNKPISWVGALDIDPILGLSSL